LAGKVEYEVAGLKLSSILLFGKALCYKRCSLDKRLPSVGSVASISESEERLVFRHNYPSKAINCL
jgi:hypothetical protein